MSEAPLASTGTASTHATSWSRRLAALTTPLGRAGTLLGFAILVLLIWMDQSVFPLGVAVQGPDGSFQTAFEHFFKHASRAGVEWVYTYGPLGFIENFTYDSDLFVGRLVFADVLWRLTCAAALSLAFLRNQTAYERAIGFVAVILLPLNPDAYIYLFTLAVAEICISRPDKRTLLVLALLVLVPASLAKFTSFGLLVPCLIVIGAAIWRARSRRAAFVFIGTAALLWIALWWIVCRQSLFDIFPFLARSFEMAGAYSTTMGSECPPAIEERGMWVLGLTAACFALPLFGVGVEARYAPGLLRGFVLIGVFKAGFVRGADHGMIFFTFAAIAPFAIVDELPAGSWRRIAFVVLRLVNLVVATFGVLQTQGVTGSVVTTLATRAGEQIDWALRLAKEPRQVRLELDYQIGQARELRALPLTRAAVGNDTIDIHPPFQDSILFNDLNWRPRPVFQSYATLSEGLQQLNARFFDSDRAPQWFLLMPRAIDARLETMEDAPAMLIIARDYKPVLVEQNMLLCRRDPQPKSQATDEVLIERELAYGEALDLSSLGDDIHLLQLEASPTWLGRLRAITLRPAPIHAVLATKSGRHVVVQLIPSMLRTGAIIDPMLSDVRDWVQFYAGRGDRTTALTLMPSADLSWAYPKTLKVRILRSSIRPRRVDIDKMTAQRFAMFETMPADFTGVDDGRIVDEAGKTVFAVGTPCVLKFKVAPGRHAVSGSFGLLAEAYEKGASDGVTFQAHFLRGPTQYEKVFERTIDPRANPAERGVIPFAFEFDADVPGEIALTMRPGPKNDYKDDTAFWTDVAVK